MANHERKPGQKDRKIVMQLPENIEENSFNKSEFQVRKRSYCFMRQKDDSYNRDGEAG
jgi:hypothetical protein